MTLVNLNPSGSGDLDGSVGLTDKDVLAVLGAGGLSQSYLAGAAKPPCLVSATSNHDLGGLPSLDGVALTAGDMVLLTAQTVRLQNGPWVANAGNWKRPDWFATGNSLQAVAGSTVLVMGGSARAGSWWRLVRAAVVDRTDQVWEQIVPVVNSSMYNPGDPASWDGTPPTTVGAAIDRLATLVKILNGGTGP